MPHLKILKVVWDFLSSKVGLVLILVLVCFAGWKYSSNLKQTAAEFKEIAEEGERELNDQLRRHGETVLEYNKLLQLREDAAIQYKMDLEDLGRQHLTNQDEVHRLESLLARHDLAYLAKRKPGLVQKRVNRATEKVFADIESATK